MQEFHYLSEVKQAAKEQNKLLVVYHNNVLDVTDFDHPGPQEDITGNVGTDITEKFEDAEHSNYARELCDRYKIGKLIDQTGRLLTNDFEVISKEEQELHRIVESKVDVKKPLLP